MLQMIQRNTRILIQLVGEILDFRELYLVAVGELAVFEYGVARVKI